MSENSMREVEIFIGSDLDADEIKDALNSIDECGDGADELKDIAHALLTEHEDDRAQVHDVTIDSVTIDPEHPSVVSIEMSISWGAYYGCRDMNRGGLEEVVESATYTDDGSLIFHVPLPRREANHC
jgi:hypothetical protein